MKDSILVQTGTPNNILLNPADEYVSDFVRDVNRAKVLNIDTLSRALALRITHDNLDRALEEMRKTGEAYGYVYHNNIIRGVLTKDVLTEAVKTAIKCKLHPISHKN